MYISSVPENWNPIEYLLTLPIGDFLASDLVLLRMLRSLHGKHCKKTQIILTGGMLLGGPHAYAPHLVLLPNLKETQAAIFDNLE